MTKEQALKILHKGTVYNPLYLDALNMAIKSLEEERPKGKWRLRPLNQTWEVYCTNCNNGKGFMWDEDYLTEYKKHPQHAYCGWCGADMRESEVEE